MVELRRIVLVRHGETDGESSVRFHGSSDVDLSDEGRGQMRRVAGRLGPESFDLVVASPLRRSWRSAALLGRGAPVRLEDDFREIDFGRWEGLTRQEIEARDPIAYQDWQARAPGFEFPGGEKRSEFQARVKSGLARLLATDAGSALVVVHKGVIRTLADALCGDALEPEEPGLGEVLVYTRAGDRSWFRGMRSSNPEGVGPDVLTSAR